MGLGDWLRGGRLRGGDDRALIVTDGVGEWAPVVSQDASAVHTEAGSYPLEAVTVIPMTANEKVYIVHADLPARMAAEEVQRIRESVFLQTLFDDTTGGPGGVPWPMWVLLGLTVLGLVIGNVA